MWFVVQVLLAGVLVCVALVGSWWVVWKLLLSKFPVFQEILGLRPSLAVLTAGVSGAPGSIQTAEQAAALKKKKQREANTYVLTRSGEQMAQTQRRQSMRNAALAQQAAQGAQAGALPTTTPRSVTPVASSSPHQLHKPPLASWVPESRTPALAAAATPFVSATPGAATPGQLPLGTTGMRQRGQSSASAALRQLQQQHLQQLGGATPVLGHASAVPTSNQSAAALAAEALLRRQQTMESSGILPGASATPPAAAMMAPAPVPAPAAPTAAAATPTTIGGSGWLQRAAIIEDYQPNS